jgi:hypothetical protein
MPHEVPHPWIERALIVVTIGVLLFVILAS